MVILLSNDDGVNAKGILALADRLRTIADVWVVAPDREKSAASHSITLHRPLKISRLDEKVFAVDGTPTDCVIIGVHKILPVEPDIIVSGINYGPNLGDDITYSGTVSAAMEGTILGFPSVAFSLDVDRFKNFTAAADVALKIVKWMYKNRLPQGVLLNVNIPDVKDIRDLKGIMWTRQGRRVYKDYIYELEDPRGNTYFWIGGVPAREEEEENAQETDIWAVRNGYVSITPVKMDLTDYNMLEKMRCLKDKGKIWLDL